MENQTKTSKELFSVKDKVIILTGGTGFLGAYYNEFLTKEGAKVVVWDLPELDPVIQLSARSARKSPKGDRKMIYGVDITDENVVQKATEDVLKKYERVDVLINNAAMNPAVGSEDSKKMFAPVDDYPVELWAKELDVNLKGMFICSKAVIRAMKKQGKGVIINIASEVSEIAHDHRVYNEPGRYKSTAYITSKTGVVGLTRALAAQLGQYNIRVNSLSPGGVENPKMPKDFVERFGNTNMLGRMARPDEYNAAILFLSSDASSFMTGHNLVIDGGKSAW